MAETGHGEPVLFLESPGKAEQIFEAPSRDDHILVELGQAGVAQGVGKLASDLPDLFRSGSSQTTLDKERTSGAHGPLEILEFKKNRAPVAIQFHNHVRAAAS